jgi:hypothetical protein
MVTFCALLAAAGYAIFISGLFIYPVIDAISSELTYIRYASLASGNKLSDYGALFLQIVGIYTVTPCLVTSTKPGAFTGRVRRN